MPKLLVVDLLAEREAFGKYGTAEGEIIETSYLKHTEDSIKKRISKKIFKDSRINIKSR